MTVKLNLIKSKDISKEMDRGLARTKRNEYPCTSMDTACQYRDGNKCKFSEMKLKEPNAMAIVYNSPSKLTGRSVVIRKYQVSRRPCK